jgi:hypothetical protein
MMTTRNKMRRMRIDNFIKSDTSTKLHCSCLTMRFQKLRIVVSNVSMRGARLLRNLRDFYNICYLPSFQHGMIPERNRIKLRRKKPKSIFLQHSIANIKTRKHDAHHVFFPTDILSHYNPVSIE